MGMKDIGTGKKTVQLAFILFDFIFSSFNFRRDYMAL